MAETPIFSPYFRGTGIPGWLSRMFWPGNLDEQNANIEAARIREAAGEDRADILNELKAQMGPRYAKVPYIEPSSEKLRRAALLMQPSSELTGQEQLGPVKQSPTFDWMRQFDQPQTPMATAVFQPPTPTAPLGVQTPSRATWGDEARFPQGGPVTPASPYGLTDADVEAGGPMMARLREYERMFTTPTTMAADLAPRYAPPPAMPEQVGGATAYAPPPPPSDVIPQYLRRPETTEAPPPPPDTFVPGGERTQVPGRTFTELLVSDPRLGAFAAANLPKLQTAEAEYAGNQAVQGYVQDVRVNGMPEDKALAKWGAGLDQSELGRKLADNARERLTQRATAGKEARAAKQEQAAAQWATDEATRLEATGDPDDAALAKILRAGAVSKDLAKSIQDYREHQAKLADAKAKLLQARAPTREATLWEAATADLQSENPGSTPTRGQTAQRVLKLAAKEGAPTSETTIRDAARQDLVDRGDPNPTEGKISQRAVEIKKEVGKAGAPSVQVMTGSERKDVAGDLAKIDRLDFILSKEQEMRQYIGAYGWNTSLNMVLDAIATRDGAPVRDQWRAEAIAASAAALHDLTGAATGNDRAYREATPDILTARTAGEFFAKVRTQREDLRRVLDYRERLRVAGQLNLPPEQRTVPPPLPAPLYGPNGELIQRPPPERPGSRPPPPATPGSAPPAPTDPNRRLLDRHK